jgi:hypothetical protein
MSLSFLQKKKVTKEKLPATPCPVKGCALAELVLLRAFLMPVGWLFMVCAFILGF